jgi:amino acid adenylation domain-containing protein
LGEIENQLLKHDKISETVVVSREDENGDKYLRAYIVGTAANAIPATMELREYLSQILPDYMIPTYFMQLEKLPLIPNGKIDRKALPNPVVQAGGYYAPPGDMVEAKLVSLWAEILGLEEKVIGIDHNFFSLGGHSLKAVSLLAKIHREFNVNIPLALVFKTPTIRSISGSIQQAVKDEFSSITPIEKREYYPLSSAQKRLYFLQQLDLNSTGYNMPFILPMGKNIETNKLESSLKQLIARHEGLRSSFVMIRGEPFQKIQDNVRFTIKYHDLKRARVEVKVQVEENEGTRGLAPLFIKDFIRPFDLSQAPLIRSGLIKLPDGHYAWIVDIHHIVSDGTSHMILAEDFISLYEGGELPSLELQYKDFSQWQDRLFISDRMEAQEKYWLELYADAGSIPRLDLPVDCNRPKVLTFEGDRYSFLLEREEAVKLKALGSRNNGTLYMNILAALNTLFYKYSGQTDVIIGGGISGRSHADLQSIVGMFVNTLAMRNYPEGLKTYEWFLKEVIARTVKAFENQDVQFEELVDKLEVERDLSRNPLFDIMMVVQNFRTVRDEKKYPDSKKKNFRQPQLETLLVPTENLPSLKYRLSTSKFDMTFFVHERGENIHFSIEYYTSIFKQRTIVSLIRHFKKVIKAVVTNPGIKLKDINILSLEEKEAILYQFNDTTRDYPYNKTLGELFEQQVSATPNRIALVGEDPLTSAHQCLSYRELNEKSNHLSRLLKSKGVTVDTIVGIMPDRCIEMSIGILGILKTGGAYLPVDPDYPEERKQYLLTDSGAKIVLTLKKYEEHKGHVARWDGERIFLDNLQPAPISTNRAPSSRSLAYIIYTSGSTGRPKGVMVAHHNVIRLVKNTNFITFASRDKLLQTGALNFDASTFEIWGSFLNGITLCLISKDGLINPDQLKSAILKKNITIMWMTAPLFNRMLQEDIEIFKGLKKLLVGGDVLSPPHIRQVKETYPQLKLINGYGPTENTTFSTTHPVELPLIGNISIGKPITNSTAYILDKNGSLLPVGVPGELVLGGEGEILPPAARGDSF